MTANDLGTLPMDPTLLGRRIAFTSIIVSGSLATTKIFIGLLAHSTSVVADGVESAADVLTASLVYAGLLIASRPADQQHPYGHGRAEIIAGLVLGVVLTLTGIGICSQSLRHYTMQHLPPEWFGIWPLLASILAKSILAGVKFRYGRKIGSASLVADGWNDAVDILSGSSALVALGFTLYDPSRFLAADHFGGFAVGLIVIIMGIRVAREASLQLMDTMPGAELIDAIRASASRVEGVAGTEKCRARKTGLRFHVDLHLEVDPQMSVVDAHGIAERVRHQIYEDLPEVADVLVHIEPAPRRQPCSQPGSGEAARRDSSSSGTGGG